MSRFFVLGVAILVATLIPEATHAQDRSLPEGVDAQRVAEGERLFRSEGLCFACHAPDGSGVPGAGADLTDDEWLHLSPEVGAIADLIRRGVPPGEAKGNAIMPPKGGSQLTDDQIRSVAAYVWTLAHGSS